MAPHAAHDLPDQRVAIDGLRPRLHEPVRIKRCRLGLIGEFSTSARDLLIEG